MRRTKATAAATVLMAALALAGALAGCSAQGGAATSRQTTSSLHGVVPSTTQTRPAFTLADTTGKQYDFQQQTRGRVTLLYFGYTHCPDECPTAMADIAAALRSLPQQLWSQVTVVFATTDPWRDTPAVLRRWLDKFHPPTPYVGLTGTPTQIAGAETTMGMPISVRETPTPGANVGQYAVSHFAGVLLYDHEDRLATLYPSGVSPADIAADLRALVKG